VPGWAPPLVAFAVLLAIVAVGVALQRYADQTVGWEADFRRKLRHWDGFVPVWVQDEARSRRR
jgi:hypothetical protein